MNNEQRGDFILVVCRTIDTELQKLFMKIWELPSSWFASIYLLEFSLIFSNDVVYEIIERSAFQSDAFAFYRQGYNAIFITDTGR